MTLRNPSFVKVRKLLIAATVLLWCSLGYSIAGIGLSIIFLIYYQEESDYYDYDEEITSFAIGEIAGVSISTVAILAMTIFATIITVKSKHRLNLAHPFGIKSRAVGTSLIVSSSLLLSWSIIGIILSGVAVRSSFGINFGIYVLAIAPAILCIISGVKIKKCGNGPLEKPYQQQIGVLPVAVSYTPEYQQPPQSTITPTWVPDFGNTSASQPPSQPQQSFSGPAFSYAPNSTPIITQNKPITPETLNAAPAPMPVAHSARSNNPLFAHRQH